MSGIEDWRIAFRERIVDRMDDLRGGILPQHLRGVSMFVEAVAEEIGPEMRIAGFDEAEESAEYQAALRCCHLMDVAHQVAALLNVSRVECLEPADRERFVRLKAALLAESDLLWRMSVHAQLLEDPAAHAALSAARVVMSHPER